MLYFGVKLPDVDSSNQLKVSLRYVDLVFVVKNYVNVFVSTTHAYSHASVKRRRVDVLLIDFENFLQKLNVIR